MVAKRKAVINAEVDQLRRAEVLIKAGRYASLSHFVREALSEKLERIRRDELEAQVQAYCAAGHGDEDPDLVGAQAFPGRARRAKR